MRISVDDNTMVKEAIKLAEASRVEASRSSKQNEICSRAIRKGKSGKKSNRIRKENTMSDAFVYTAPDLEDFGNQVKDVLLEVLAKEGHIDKEKVVELSKNYFIHVKQSSRLSKFLKKLLGKDKREDYILVIGRFCNRHNIEADEVAAKEEKEEQQNERKQKCYLF